MVPRIVKMHDFKLSSPGFTHSPNSDLKSFVQTPGFESLTKDKKSSNRHKIKLHSEKHSQFVSTLQTQSVDDRIQHTRNPAVGSLQSNSLQSDQLSEHTNESKIQPMMLLTQKK